MKLLALAFFGSLLFIAPHFAWAEGTQFSGFELFAGIKLNGVTIGATFSGWTDQAATWVPFSQSTGGFVTGSINYIGKPGFGKTVTIIGGKWTWLEADDHTTHSGPVVSGTVTWPLRPDDIGCGAGIALFNANLHDSISNTDGAISGCLNDQLTFPPKIWGALNLPLPP